MRLATVIFRILCEALKSITVSHRLSIKNELTKETHERLFLALRAARPDLPIIIMTRPAVGQTGSSRYNTAKKTYDNAIAKGDQNVYFLCGDDLTEFSGRDGTADGTHPSDIGFYSMSLPVTKVLGQILLKNKYSAL